MSPEGQRCQASPSSPETLRTSWSKICPQIGGICNGEHIKISQFDNDDQSFAHINVSFLYSYILKKKNSQVLDVGLTDEVNLADKAVYVLVLQDFFYAKIFF